MSQDTILLKALRAKTIIGIFPWERRIKQPVEVDLAFPAPIARAACADRIEAALDYKKIAKAALAFMEKSRFFLLETLAEELARHLLERFALETLEVTVSKPGAVRFSKNVSVHIHRRGKTLPWVLLGFGSNIAPKRHFLFALEQLQKTFPIAALSHVYETPPVGGRRQPAFWNLAAGMQTALPPFRLKALLHRLEAACGRKRTQNRFAPRTLDIDLLITGENTSLFQTHPDWSEKPFAVFPVLEIAPRLHVNGRSLVEIAALLPTFPLKKLPPQTLPGFAPFGAMDV